MNMIAPTRRRMTVEEFLAWEPEDGKRWQLVDGEPEEMAPTNRSHGQVHTNLIVLIGNHVRAGATLDLITAPGVRPRGPNLRIPEMAVVPRGYAVEQRCLPDPVLAVEVLSPSNARQTWSNVWTFTTIPSMREILVVETEAMAVEIVRRRPDGAWPDDAVRIDAGRFTLESIGLELSLPDLYSGTLFDQR